MKIVIKKSEYKDGVFVDKVLFGSVGKFCCGVDFYYEDKNMLFSIAGVKMKTPELKFCIEKLLSLNLTKSKKYKHYGFSYKIAKSPSLLKKCKEAIMNT